MRFGKLIPGAMMAAALTVRAGAALAQDANGGGDAAPESWSLHAQATFLDQYHPAFASTFQGKNSLDPGSRGDETADTTLYAGVALWNGGEAYINPEVDQGFGLSDTIGVAGFTSGEAYKIGSAPPYFRLQRLFFRQSFDLGGDSETVAPGANQLGGSRTQDNLVITAGKFSVTDIFDTNGYAHDPRGDFMNWSIIDSGAYDYAADSWGYSYGVAGEWTQDWWTWRLGLFDLSRQPNERALTRGFGQYELVTEGEERHTLWGRDGKLKLLLFVNRGRFGSYDDAVALGLATHAIPDTSLVRKPVSRPGGALNLEQTISGDLGGFVRASLNDGSKEADEFTEINDSLAVGLSLKGARWGRPDDTVGLASVVNELSKDGQRYFALGGMGILIGDGALPRYHSEDIVETYYSAQLTGWLAATADYQFIANPAYNPERGPVSVLSVRLHAQF